MRTSFIITVAIVSSFASAVDPLGVSLLTSQVPIISADSNIVDLTYARYKGLTLQNGVNQWLSLRFAAPPTGTRRFAAPQPPLMESSTQDATKVLSLS